MALGTLREVLVLMSDVGMTMLSTEIHLDNMGGQWMGVRGGDPL